MTNILINKSVFKSDLKTSENEEHQKQLKMYQIESNNTIQET